MTQHHPSVQHLLDLFAYDHLPIYLQRVAAPIADLAHKSADTLGGSPELAAGLRKLLEAKDCLVRQAVIDHREKRTANDD